MFRYTTESHPWRDVYLSLSHLLSSPAENRYFYVVIIFLILNVENRVRSAPSRRRHRFIRFLRDSDENFARS